MRLYKNLYLTKPFIIPAEPNVKPIPQEEKNPSIDILAAHKKNNFINPQTNII